MTVVVTADRTVVHFRTLPRDLWTRDFRFTGRENPGFGLGLLYSLETRKSPRARKEIADMARLLRGSAQISAAASRSRGGTTGVLCGICNESSLTAVAIQVFASSPLPPSPVQHAVSCRSDIGRVDHSSAITLPVPQLAAVYQLAQGCRQQNQRSRR